MTEISSSSSLPRVAILGMGGTIAMVPGPLGSLIPARSAEDLVATVPLLRDLAHIDVVQVENLDSTDVDSAHWVRLVDKIVELYESYDAFIVTHGTDTMAYTSGATALAVGSGLSKPIVFTGSQLPISYLGNDARANLENAFMVALAGIKRGNGEVMVVFGHRVLRATRCLKMSEAEFDAFGSPAFPEVATIDATGVSFRPESRQFLGSRSQGLKVQNRFDNRVLTLDVMPGQDPELFGALLENKGEHGCRALVLKSLGAGNIPVKLLPLVKKAVDMDIAVFIATKFAGGRSLPMVYESGRRAVELGASPTGDLTDVMVQVKLMWLLGQGVTGVSELQTRLLEDCVGEVTSGFYVSDESLTAEVLAGEES